ncbi:ABC-type phosphate transport system, periplasmic component [Desulfuromonas soudanensis]|uniref:ABC-type phosphate transport system, periplasmic component n=1 Tax=Desulfuromonas soudanensis TaxID=1603606 RepID=A0A0M4D2Z9_9BACT|nr:substrate-binding domain-containing protein [Desulfuromonas soudanensis]ALC16764.1 ABC-type phosphate transport system, periplasmic component [Desulfuromonas soudanensis]
MKKHGLLIFLLLLVLAFPREGSAEKIVVAGTGDSQELLRLLAAAYEKSHPDSTIEVPESIGSSGGIKAVARGVCDLARVARPLNNKETLLGLKGRVFAVSPVVIAANLSSSAVENISSAQLVEIYSGAMTDWSEIGGTPGKILVANREAGDSSRSALEKHVAGFAEIREFAGRILYNTPEAMEILARHGNTIGYGPLAMVRHTNIRVLKLDGNSPTEENVLSGKYPLSTAFSLVWKGELTGLAREFVRYLEGAEARKIIVDQGAYPSAGGRH